LYDYIGIGKSGFSFPSLVGLRKNGEMFRNTGFSFGELKASLVTGKDLPSKALVAKNWISIRIWIHQNWIRIL
jgi:hypothetical protein